jgi:hypothetical protein
LQDAQRSEGECGLLGTLTGHGEGGAKVDILLGQPPKWDDKGSELLLFMK